MVKKLQIVIAYDISNNKRRKKVADLLSSKGYRMNYSVFECILSEKQLTNLIDKLQRVIHKRQDSILIYPLDKFSISHSIYLGNAAQTDLSFITV